MAVMSDFSDFLNVVEEPSKLVPCSQMAPERYRSAGMLTALMFPRRSVKSVWTQSIPDSANDLFASSIPDRIDVLSHWMIRMEFNSARVNSEVRMMTEGAI